MTNKKIVVLSSIVILILIIILYQFRIEKPVVNHSPSLQTQQKTSLTQPKNNHQDIKSPHDLLSKSLQPFYTGLENLPNSLHNTSVDGEIIINEQKNLIVTEGLRRLFDYFLSTLGEEDEQTIIIRVESYISYHTPEPASHQAIEIFHQYIKYLKALANIKDKYGNLQMRMTQAGKFDLSLFVQQRQEQSQLRRRYFSPETIKIFFEEEDALNDYNLAMLEISQNDNLSDIEKFNQQQYYINQKASPLIKQEFEKQQQLIELMQKTEKMKQQGATDKELFDMRQSLYNTQVAERLAKIDKEDDDFAQRFSQYQRQKQQLLENEPILAEQKIQELQKQLFNTNEIKRLEGYEKWINHNNK